MYVTVKQKHVIEIVRKKAVFIKVDNFTYLNFRTRKLTKIGLACASKELLETILITTFITFIQKLLVLEWE